MQCRKMATVLVSLSVFLLMVSTFSELCAAQSEDTNVRLLRIEATLENVLERNKVLEERIAALENENNALKHLVSDIIQQKSEPEESVKTVNLLKAGHQKHNKHNRIGAYKSAPPLNVPGKLRRQIDPATVAFTATVSPHSINVGPGQTVIFDSVVTNVGRAYNNQSGVFTAPVSGVYVFNFAEMIDAGSNEYLGLMKDGALVMWNFGHAQGANHLVSSSRTATVEVNKGSQVWVQTPQSATHGTGLIHGNTFTTFSGWVLAVTE